MAEPRAADRFLLLCLRCERRVLARDEWIGREVQCPHCGAVLLVPPRAPDDRPVMAAAPSVAPRRNFTFSCQRCGCLLEAHTGLSGQAGSCPTCAVRFYVPHINPDTGMPFPTRLLDTEQADPTPMHAYAASGHQAPQLRRRPDGEMEIECPRCHARCPVDAHTCKACGTPFTMDAAPTMDKIRTDSRATAALILGILSVPFFFTVVTPVLAVIFGLISVFSPGGEVSPRAIVGLVLGAIALAMTVFLFLP
ncbi:MAG: hypothetical protein LC135_14500 [Phycisphaerae bacterium]|nr:hypothetical protein [Phycisphaerae bacterium]MCZ2401054.1 hypothetical protein [Phycisphaerae bacterium]